MVVIRTRLQLSLWIPALSGLRYFLWLLWLYCYFATNASGYCGYYNQVVALVSLTCHMFTMSPITAICSFRTSEYSVSWSRVLGSIAAFISLQEVIFSVFTNYPLSTPTYFPLIPFDLTYPFPFPLFVLATDSLPNLSSSSFFTLKLSLTPLFFQYSFRNFIFLPPFINIPFPLL